MFWSESRLHQKLNLILQSQDRIERRLNHILERTIHMAQELDALEAEVARNGEVDSSALILIQGIVAKLEAAQGDPAKIAALTSQLRSSSDALAAAVAANT